LNDISFEDLQKYRERGYNEDLLPKGSSSRNWGTFNYFTLWMGSVHNVPNYIAVGGFFLLGLSASSISLAILFSSIFIAAAMVLNGAAGSKYGIPFSMLLRASYGIRGSLFPGILRGGIAAIMWFGLQNYAGSLALQILIGKLIPGFLTIGGSANIFGLSIPGFICFIIFCAINIGIALGGGALLNKFTAILNPLIYIVFGGMAIWVLSQVSIVEVLSYSPENVIVSGNKFFLFFVIVNAIVAVWAAPACSASDFTQNAISFKAQAIGQTLGLIVSYALFAFTSVVIIAGASIIYGADTWNILEIVQKWDSLFTSAFALIVLLMTTISTNATGNIVPAAYQLVATFPKKVNYRQGILIASVLSILTLPWKLMENSSSIYGFLDVIGGILGPVIGVMLANYFILIRQEISLNLLYTEESNFSYYKNGVNVLAIISTILAVILSLGGKFIPLLEPLSRLAWFVGVLSAFGIYVVLSSIYKPTAPDSNSLAKEKLLH
jgi:allantoin permease